MCSFLHLKKRTVLVQSIHPQMTSVFEWWHCAQWKALYVSASQWIQEVLWSVLSVIQCCGWRFPFLLSRSRRWDHRTSLHRWQPRLKVSRSRGACRLLARCEILPCMLFLLVPDPLLPREMGCHSFPPEAEKKKACNLVFYCPPRLFFRLFPDQKENTMSYHLALFYFYFLRHVTIKNKLIFLPYDFLQI